MHDAQLSRDLLVEALAPLRRGVPSGSAALRTATEVVRRCKAQGDAMIGGMGEFWPLLADEGRLLEPAPPGQDDQANTGIARTAKLLKGGIARRLKLPLDDFPGRWRARSSRYRPGRASGVLGARSPVTQPAARAGARAPPARAKAYQRASLNRSQAPQAR